MVQVALEDLEGEMRDLAELIGFDLVLTLCTMFAGDNIYIPLKGKSGDSDIKEIKGLLGPEKYEIVQMRFGGTVIYFPQRETLLKNYIAKQVKKEYDGSNRRQLMRKYGLTKTAFYRMIEEKQGRIRQREDPDQLNIFDFLPKSS